MDALVNIGPKERAKRRNVGVVMLLISAGAAVWMNAEGMEPIWRVTLAFPIGLGVLGLWQSMTST